MNIKRIFSRSLIAITILALVACGPIKIDSVAPGVSLESVSIEGPDLRINLLINNRNDNPILLTMAQLELEVEHTPIFNITRPTELDISPRGRESLIVTVPIEPGGLETLQGIQTAGAYRLTGELEFQKLNDYSFNVSGFLHPVPGQPGRYR